jgi:hypothetical protein
VWERLAAVDGFVADSAANRFTLGDHVYNVDEYSRIDDDDFDRLVSYLRERMSGTLIPVKLTVNDAYVIGYLTSITKFVIKGPMVEAIREGGRVSGPVADLPLPRRDALFASFRQWTSEFGISALIHPNASWHLYVTCAYAWAKQRGMACTDWADCDFSAQAAPVLTTAAETAALIARNVLSNAGPAAAQANLNTYGEKAIWTNLNYAARCVQARRGLTSKLAQSLTHHMDVNPNRFGFNTLDEIAALAKHLARLDASLFDGVDILVGSDVEAHDLKTIASLFTASTAVKAYHSTPSRGTISNKAGYQVEYNPYGTLPPGAASHLILDLGVGKTMDNMDRKVMEGKLHGYCGAAALFVLYTPDPQGANVQRNSANRLVLPMGMREAYERYEDVDFRPTARWHQPDYYLLAQRLRPTARIYMPAQLRAGSRADPDGEFAAGPVKSWIRFSAARAAIAMGGNLWMKACADVCIRKAPPFGVGPRLDYVPSKAHKSVDQVFGIVVVTKAGVSDLELDFGFGDAAVGGFGIEPEQEPVTGVGHGRKRTRGKERVPRDEPDEVDSEAQPMEVGAYSLLPARSRRGLAAPASPDVGAE